MEKNFYRMKSKNKKQLNPFPVYLFAITPFLGGLSQHYQIFILAILSAIVLIFRWKDIDFYRPDLQTLIPIALIIIFSVASVFYGESRGDALYGLFHVIAALLFWVMLRSFSEGERKEAMSIIPYAAAAMVIVNGIAYIIPGLKDLMYVNSRMGGAFGYSNTFAIYLLIGLYILLDSFLDRTARKNRVADYVVIAILLAGILLSGSRSVFIMTAVLFVYLIIVKKDGRKILLAIIGITVLCAGAFVLFTNDMSSIGRFLTISSSSSSFLGRILYDIDAIKMIANRPFGYGYLGYYFVQHFYQTGVYSVRFAHNDWLQIALDFGVIALASFVWLYFRGLRRANTREKVILVLIGVHMLFDFDIQFFSIMMIMLLCFTGTQTSAVANVRRIKFNASAVKVIGNATLVCVIIASAWLGLADFMQSSSMKDDSLNIYPWAADVKLHVMADTDDGQKKKQYAKELIGSVPYIGPSYDVMSAAYLEEQDVDKAMDMKYKSVVYQKYDIKKYEEFSDMLDDIAERYRDIDLEIYNKALKYQSEIPDMLEKVKNETSPLAYMINDVPEFTMYK